MRFTVPGKVRGKGVPLRSYEMTRDDSDYGRAANLAKFLCPESEWLRYLVVEGNPNSKARARFGAGNHFYAPDATAEKALRARLKQAFPEPMSGNIAVGCIFFRKDKHRIDVDNMLKHVMDAATSACWHDDSQVTAKLGFVEMDSERPRTVIVMGQHQSTMDRSPLPARPCKQCGKEFTRYGSGPFCSRLCASHSRGEDLRAVQKCRACGTEFKRGNCKQVVCSEACRLSEMNKRASARGAPKPTCKACGTKLSRHGYVLCRACWRTARSKNATGIVLFKEYPSGN